MHQVMRITQDCCILYSIFIFHFKFNIKIIKKKKQIKKIQSDSVVNFLRLYVLGKLKLYSLFRVLLEIKLLLLKNKKPRKKNLKIIYWPKYCPKKLAADVSCDLYIISCYFYFFIIIILFFAQYHFYLRIFVYCACAT